MLLKHPEFTLKRLDNSPRIISVGLFFYLSWEAFSIACSRWERRPLNLRREICGFRGSGAGSRTFRVFNAT